MSLQRSTAKHIGNGQNNNFAHVKAISTTRAHAQTSKLFPFEAEIRRVPMEAKFSIWNSEWLRCVILWTIKVSFIKTANNFHSALIECVFSSKQKWLSFFDFDSLSNSTTSERRHAMNRKNQRTFPKAELAQTFSRNMRHSEFDREQKKRSVEVIRLVILDRFVENAATNYSNSIQSSIHRGLLPARPHRCRRTSYQLQTA